MVADNGHFILSFASCVACCARNHMQLLKQNVAFEDCMWRLPNEPQYATILNRTGLHVAVAYMNHNMRLLNRTLRFRIA